MFLKKGQYTKMMPKRVKDFFYSVRETLENVKTERKAKKDEGIALINRIRKAEKDFPEAYQIASHLNQEKNRKILAKALSTNHPEVESEDFEGAKVVETDELRKELMQRYGLKATPLIISIPPKKWNGFEKQDGVASRFGLGKNLGGVAVYSENMPKPFRDLGQIIFIPENALYSTKKHEAMHQLRTRYKEKSFKIEGRLIGEFFAESSKVSRPVDWLKITREDEIWGNWIKSYSIGLTKESKARLLQKIKKTGNALAYLQLKTSPSIVVQILMNSENLDEIISYQRTELRKYENKIKEKYEEIDFCIDVINKYRAKYPVKSGKVKKFLKNYNFTEINKKDIEKVVDEIYHPSGKQNNWVNIQT